MADFRCFPGWPHLNVFGYIPVGNAFGESEVWVPRLVASLRHGKHRRSIVCRLIFSRWAMRLVGRPAIASAECPPDARSESLARPDACAAAGIV